MYDLIKITSPHACHLISFHGYEYICGIYGQSNLQKCLIRYGYYELNDPYTRNICN